jgi:PKD repeat protein
MVTNALGSDSTTTQVRILPADAQITAPVASFYHNGPTQLGQKTTFVNTSQDGGDTNENVQYDWKFDDGVSSISINPAHLYSMPGTYTVQLRVTNSVGMDTFSDTVEIIDPTTTTGETFIFLPLIIK